MVITQNTVIHFHSASLCAFSYKLKGKATSFSHLSDLRTAQSGAASTKINKGNLDFPRKSPITMWL